MLTGCTGVEMTKAAGQEAENKTAGNSVSGNVVVSFINVGQAESILIQSYDGKNMLIDAGETIDNAVIDYLNGAGVKKLDVVIATHPHSDHISDMANVIKNYEIGTFYMPDVTHTSKTFEKMVSALEDKNVNVEEAKNGIDVPFSENVKCRMVAPCSKFYDDLNNYSAVLRMEYGDTSFLFTGDAEEQSEREILASGEDISADVLNVGHHGSSSSTSERFLEKVAPSIAVISCGINNDYGHPHKETIQKLNERGITTYITRDEDKAVILKSDGEKIYKENELIVQKGNSGEESDIESKISDKKEDRAVSAADGEFIGNVNTKKLHSSDCTKLPNENNRVYFKTVQDGINEGYVPHSCIKNN